ncbi:hypothetical protein ACSBPU_08765 [Parapusillimonas sp. JC17]
MPHDTANSTAAVLNEDGGTHWWTRFGSQALTAAIEQVLTGN